jgi:hypothetical protein
MKALLQGLPSALPVRNCGEWDWGLICELRKDRAILTQFTVQLMPVATV